MLRQILFDSWRWLSRSRIEHAVQDCAIAQPPAAIAGADAAGAVSDSVIERPAICAAERGGPFRTPAGVQGMLRHRRPGMAVFLAGAAMPDDALQPVFEPAEVAPPEAGRGPAAQHEDAAPPASLEPATGAVHEMALGHSGVGSLAQRLRQVGATNRRCRTIPILKRQARVAFSKTEDAAALIKARKNLLTIEPPSLTLAHAA